MIWGVYGVIFFSGIIAAKGDKLTSVLAKVPSRKLRGGGLKIRENQRLKIGEREGGGATGER